MTDAWHSLPYETISLDGVLYSVKPTIGFRDLLRFENRAVIGDPSKDDDELLSTKVWSDFSGGCGVFDEKEGADTGVFWDSEGLDIDHPSQLALGPIVQSFTISGTNAFVLGEAGVTESTLKAHFSFDLNIYEFNETTDAIVDTTYDLAFTPVNKGLRFQGALWIPQGSNGYQVFTPGSGVVNGTAGITAYAFCLWDNKVIAIEHNRQLSIYNPITSTWDSPATAILESGQSVRDVIAYYNRSDEPSIYVQTTTALWGYDEVTQVFVRTNVVLPPHPDNGKGLAVWRTGETLYIGASLGVYAWTGPGGTLSPMGLDRKQGIPIAYQGRIVDLTPTLNHLYAVVQAIGTGTLYHSLYRYNGNGWCRMWAHTNKTDTINWAMSTGAASVQRVWWDAGNKIYSIEVPRSYANPRELLKGLSGNFGTTGYLITSWFDANMELFDKLYSYLLFSGQSIVQIDENVQVYYQTDDTSADVITDPGWTNKGTTSANTTYYSLDFSSLRIRLYLKFRGTAVTKSPLMRNINLKFMKVPVSLATYQITFDLGFEGKRFGRDAQETAEALRVLGTKRSLILLEHNQNQRNVRVSNLQGWDSTAEDRRKSRTITFVEIPVPPSTVFGTGS